MTYQHVTAPTQFAEANGIRFAYRRFGQEGGTPLLFMQHFQGGMDHWDPAVTDGFAKNRPVILFDNAGVASSSGQTPDTIDAMAGTPPISSRRLDFRRLICWASRSEDISRRPLRYGIPN